VRLWALAVVEFLLMKLLRLRKRLGGMYDMSQGKQ